MCSGYCVRQPVDGRVKLAARRDAELRKDPAKVERDSPVRDVELLADLAVRQAFGREARGLELLRRELISRFGNTAAVRHAGGAKLPASTLSPGNGAERVECLARGAQRVTRLSDPATASKPGAVGKEQARSKKRPGREIAREPGLEERLGVFVRGEQRPRIGEACLKIRKAGLGGQ